MRDLMISRSAWFFDVRLLACTLVSALASDDPPSDSPKISTVLKVHYRIVSHLGEFLGSSSRRPRE
jgi:hypothetical protein